MKKILISLLLATMAIAAMAQDYGMSVSTDVVKIVPEHLTKVWPWAAGTILQGRLVTHTGSWGRATFMAEITTTNQPPHTDFRAFDNDARSSVIVCNPSSVNAWLGIGQQASTNRGTYIAAGQWWVIENYQGAIYAVATNSCIITGRDQ